MKVVPQLLDIFLDRPDVFLTSEFLAEEIKISPRTVRKYIGILNNQIQDYGATIVSKRSLGYSLKVDDKSSFELFLVDRKRNGSSLRQLTDLSDRRRFVLNNLLLDLQPITTTSLENQLFLSKTSILNLLNDIKAELKDYGLDLIISRSGIKLQGKESQIRHFIKEYFFAETFKTPVFSLFEEELFDQNDFSEIISIVIDECKKSHLKLTDIIIHNLSIHLALMIKRIELGNIITLKNDNDYTGHRLVEYEVAEKIKSRIEDYFKLQLPIQEVDFIHSHLIGTSLGEFTEIQFLREHLIEALLDIEEAIHCSISIDENLVSNIETHLMSLRKRLEKNIQLSNPLTSSILKKYQKVVDAISDSFSKLEILKDFEITVDEWVYISLHVLANIEKKDANRKFKTLIVCATGIGSARFLKNRIEKLFSNKLIIGGTSNYYELSDIDLTSYDLIISSIDLSNLYLIPPVVHVNILMDKEDIARIEKVINSVALKESQEESEIVESTLFEKSKFIYTERKLSKNQILDIMLGKITPKLSVEELDIYKKQLSMRENFGAIVVNDKFAFPHPTKPLTNLEQVVICISKHPIIWDEDSKSVQFIFLISPSVLRNEQLKVVSPLLVQFTETKGIAEKLISNPTFENFISLFYNKKKE